MLRFRGLQRSNPSRFVDDAPHARQRADRRSARAARFTAGHSAACARDAGTNPVIDVSDSKCETECPRIEHRRWTLDRHGLSRTRRPRAVAHPREDRLRTAWRTDIRATPAAPTRVSRRAVVRAGPGSAAAVSFGAPRVRCARGARSALRFRTIPDPDGWHPSLRLKGDWLVFEIGGRRAVGLRRSLAQQGRRALQAKRRGSSPSTTRASSPSLENLARKEREIAALEPDFVDRHGVLRDQPSALRPPGQARGRARVAVVQSGTAFDGPAALHDDQSRAADAQRGGVLRRWSASSQRRASRRSSARRSRP